MWAGNQPTGTGPGRHPGPTSLSPDALRAMSGCSYRLIEGLPHFTLHPDERTSSNGLLGPLLSDYHRLHAHLWAGMPKSKEEARALGETAYNALAVSVVSMPNGETPGELALVRREVLLAYDKYKK
jgi:hypothetical protein